MALVAFVLGTTCVNPTLAIGSSTPVIAKPRRFAPT